MKRYGTGLVALLFTLSAATPGVAQSVSRPGCFAYLVYPPDPMPHEAPTGGPDEAFACEAQSQVRSPEQMSGGDLTHQGHPVFIARTRQSTRAAPLRRLWLSRLASEQRPTHNQ